MKTKLRMAKPSDADMAMLKNLTRAFNDIDYGYMPALGEEDADTEMIASDYDANACKAFERLCEITQTGSLDRCVWSLDMLLGPENMVVDPNSDHLELHPRFALAFEAVDIVRKLTEKEHVSIVELSGIIDEAHALAAKMKEAGK